jgi:flagellar motor component MotA
MLRYLTGLGLTLFLVALAIAMIGGRAVLWLHPAPWALLLVLGVPLAATLSIHSGSAFRQAWRDAAAPLASSPSRAASIQLWARLESFIYFGVAIGSLMGWMVTFSLLSADLPRLGMKLAACLVPPFYGAVLGLACRVLRARVEAAG